MFNHLFKGGLVVQKKINIVHYWGGFPIVATSKLESSLKLVLKCSEFGWNNWLVLSKKPDDLSLISPFLEAGCQVIYHTRSKGNFDFSSIYRNYIFLKKIKCNVFHCYNDHTSPIIAAKLAGVSVKIWSKLAMSSYYEQGIKPSGLKKLMPSTRVTCLFSDRILAISAAAKQEICEQAGFEKRVTIVNVPVSLDRFVEATDSGIRGEFNLNPSDIVITAIGHFIEVKGWDVAVKAFAIVLKTIPNAKLLLVGKRTSEEYFQKICSLIKKYDLENKVIFAGNRSDIPDILKASNLFILPSRSEGTPAALIEAMAVGLPCIATDTGGIPEVIENGVNGFLFQRENERELADKIIDVYTNNKLRNDVIEAAQKGLHKYSIKTYVDTVFSHYQDLLEKIK